jgi:hypothetical protein
MANGISENGAHSPLPWYAFENKSDAMGAEIMICSAGHHVASVPIGGPIDDPEDRANAALIVRACNSHDALVKLLARCTECYGDLPHSIRALADQAALALAKE